MTQTFLIISLFLPIFTHHFFPAYLDLISLNTKHLFSYSLSQTVILSSSLFLCPFLSLSFNSFVLIQTKGNFSVSLLPICYVTSLSSYVFVCKGAGVQRLHNKKFFHVAQSKEICNSSFCAPLTGYKPTYGSESELDVMASCGWVVWTDDLLYVWASLAPLNDFHWYPHLKTVMLFYYT